MSLQEYHKTTTAELLALSTKVRSLVNHWGVEGGYKEAVLKNIIKRFLPKSFEIGTGFVVKDQSRYGEHLSSRQIDLIIYSSESPILFKEGDLVILTPDAVRGIIEVKANLINQNVEDVIRKANENGEFILTGKSNKIYPIFNGVFSYESVFRNNSIKAFQRAFDDANTRCETNSYYDCFKVNHVSINKDWFVKYWHRGNQKQLEQPEQPEQPHGIYRLEDLSFSFFISNLMAYLSEESIDDNGFMWFATDKEMMRQSSF